VRKVGTVCSLLQSDGEMSGSEILFVAAIMSGIFCSEMSLKQSWTFRHSCEITFLNPKRFVF
jgi:hypothetical protein